MDSVTGVLLAIVPSIGIGFLFYKVIKALLQADRNERLAHARWEAEQAVNTVPSSAAAPTTAPADPVSPNLPGPAPRT